MPIPPEYSEILKLISDQTKSQGLRWRESKHDSEYVARMANYSVVISINRFTEQFNKEYGVQSPVLFQLLLPEGYEFGRFEVRPDEKEYEVARDAFETASHMALSKTQMLREVVGDLRKTAV